MKIESLKAFYHLSQTLNFRETAEQLYISQPALTRQIAALEEEWGFPLFERTTRSVKLTRKGSMILRDVEHFLKNEEELLDRVRLLAGNSTLTIGYNGPPNLPFIGVLLAQWNKKYPHRPVNIVSETVPRMIAKFYDQEIDCFMVVKPSVKGMEKIHTKVIEKQTPAVILPVEHPLAGQKRITMEQLCREEKVLLPRGFNEEADQALRELCTYHNIAYAEEFVIDKEMSLHVALTKTVGILPVILDEFRCRSGNTTQLPLDGCEGVFDRVLVYGEENDNPMLKDFIQVVDFCLEQGMLPSNYSAE
ncbi:MAG: LysR family transcriptional regulator [Lachnospiraceae bacterium]|nr:LysR family transcriptional regulator [Lachnospiraceae bacterium]